MSNIKLFKSNPTVTLEMHRAILNFEKQEMKAPKLSSSLANTISTAALWRTRRPRCRSAAPGPCSHQLLLLKLTGLTNDVGNRIARLSANTKQKT